MAILNPQQYLNNVLDKAGEVGVRTAKRYAPVRTGLLRSRIVARRRGNTVRVGSTVRYARYQDPTYLHRASRAMRRYLRQ